MVEFTKEVGLLTNEKARGTNITPMVASTLVILQEARQMERVSMSGKTVSTMKAAGRTE
jgi:hypothetical protein